MLVVRSHDDYSAIEAVDASGSRPTVMPQGSGTWLGTTLKFTVNEARAARPGNVAMLGRLTELMFVEILREYMQRLPTNQGGWLAAVNDPHVGKALRLLHANPVRDWTVDELAREVATVALGAGATVHGTRGRGADALPRQLADAAGEADDARRGRTTSRKSRRESATTPKRRSIEPSSAPPALRQRPGARAPRW